MEAAATESPKATFENDFSRDPVCPDTIYPPNVESRAVTRPESGSQFTGGGRKQQQVKLAQQKEI
jgi:hypothetical protein